MGADEMKYVPATLSYPTGADGEYLPALTSGEIAKEIGRRFADVYHEMKQRDEHAEFVRQFHGGASRHPRAG